MQAVTLSKRLFNRISNAIYGSIKQKANEERNGYNATKGCH